MTAQVLEEAGNDPPRLPGVLARAHLDRWDRLPAHDPWPALISSALTPAPSAELLRTVLEEQVASPSPASWAALRRPTCGPRWSAASSSA
ncbi:hypothetical protein [Streptomyces sp. NPDC048419]|uniref:TetR/AcrR family transcriptional regulator n=1 Tax=Streptomyces sp. NPDC048419 TaxID=3365547 RepID=UPI0037196FA2